MEGKEVTEHETEMWTNTIDRAGLSNMMYIQYMLFMSGIGTSAIVEVKDEVESCQEDK